MTLRGVLALLLGLTCWAGAFATGRATTGPEGPGVSVFTVSAAIGDLEKAVTVQVAAGSSVDPLAVAKQELGVSAVVAPIVSFSVMGTFWPQFFGEDAEGARVVQSYNPAGDPTGGQGLQAIQGAEAVWTSVPGSRFRYEFGGITTRCPSLFLACSGGGPLNLDGHNDAGWLDLGNSGVLGISVSVYSRINGRMLEADTALNSNPIDHWSTDGSGFDVQTAFSHEDGHGAGLGHTLDRAAIMFPFLAPGEIKRTLSPSDAAGIRFLYPTGPLPAPLLHRLADLDTGRFVNDFEPGALNDRGEAVFVADVPTGGEGVFIASESRITEVARSGEIAAGLALGAGTAGPAVFDSRGDVLVAFELGADFPAPFGTGAALFRYQREGRRLSALVVPGQTPSPGGGVFQGAIAGSIEGSNQIVFTGVVNTAGGLAYGAFTFDNEGSIAAIAVPGDVLPGGRALAAHDPSIDHDGNVAFVARLAGDRGDSAFIRRGGSGIIELIARAGAPAAGGGFFKAVYGPKAAGDGQVLFAGELTVPQPRGRNIGLFLARPDGTIPVARPGDVSADGSRVLRVGTNRWGWSMGRDGTVAFQATLTTDSIHFAGNAIFKWSHGTFRKVVGSFYFQLGFGVISGVEAALINRRGQVLFINENFFGATSLLLADMRVEKD